jgi:hypothetical protein
MTNTDAIVNRHMARLLDRLEDAGCPEIFRQAVKSELVWLRDDLRVGEKEIDGNRVGV